MASSLLATSGMATAAGISNATAHAEKPSTLRNAVSSVTRVESRPAHATPSMPPIMYAGAAICPTTFGAS